MFYIYFIHLLLRGSLLGNKEAAKIQNINDLYKIILANYIRLGTGYEWTGKLV